MKNLKENAGNLVMSLCEVIIGILLLVNPVGFTSFVIIAIGAVLAIRGVVSVISYFRTKPEEAVRTQSLAIGVIFLVIGLFCMLRSEWFIATFPVLMVLYGVMILLAGISKVQWVADCIRMKKPWLLPMVSAILSLASAVIIIMNPFTTTAILWTFTAVVLIVEAVFDVVAVFAGGRKK